MLKKLSIYNFKAIEKIDIEFTPFTVLIGGNGCGKSTVLQAIDFMRSTAFRDIPEYLDERDWQFTDLKSKINDGACQPIRFVSTYALDFDDSTYDVEWDVEIDYKDKHKEKTWEINEKVTNLITGEMLLTYNTGGSNNNVSTADFSQFSIQSSALKLVPSYPRKDAMGLFALKSFLGKSESFELLSPEKMREKGNRGTVSSIGMGGEKLVSFIHGLGQKDELNRLVSELVGEELNIVTQTKGQPGWIDMSLEEQFELNNISIKPRHISDGLMRLIALASIVVDRNSYQQQLLFNDSESSKGGLVLLDEIEDGISQYLAKKVVDILSGLSKNHGAQIIITTHSTDFVSFIEPEHLVYLWKDKKDGSVHCKPLFSTEQMKKTLDFLNPGEVWINYSEKEILERLNQPQREVE